MQIISSKLTFFYKFIFLFLWIAGFGLGTKDVLFVEPKYDAQWIQYFGCWTAISLFIFFATGMIKAIVINKKKKRLEVSNFFKTIHIDFSEIDDIDGSALLSPKLVWFVLKSPTPFGTKISFMPAHRPVRSIGKHPLVIDLRKEFNLDKVL